jgi:uncharacterized protein involved in tolerance to divalent cations
LAAGKAWSVTKAILAANARGCTRALPSIKTINKYSKNIAKEHEKNCIHYFIAA